MQRMQIRAKPAEASPEEEGPRGPRAALRSALEFASSATVSRDASRNGPVQAVAHALLGVAPALAGLFFGQSFVEPGAASFLELAAATFGLAFVGSLVLPWIFLAAFALAFPSVSRERSRLRQALVCPYCRDEVGRDGALLCARTGCGALYHRECWDECRTAYGGCAVYGCSSKKASEVSATGWLLRTARLAVAAVLFPPRVARAIKKTQGQGFVPIYRQALAATRKITVSNERGENDGWKAIIYMAAIVVSYALPISLIHASSPNGGFLTFMDRNRALGWSILVPCIVVIPIVLPWLVALPLTCAFFTLKAIALAFQGELGALGRADEGGGTVLGRLAAGFGKKDCC